MPWYLISNLLCISPVFFMGNVLPCLSFAPQPMTCETGVQSNSCFRLPWSRSLSMLTSDSTACKLHVTRSQASSIPSPFTTVNLICFDFPNIFCNFARIYSTLTVIEHHKMQLYCWNGEGSYCVVLNSKEGKRSWSGSLSVYPFMWKYTGENTQIPRYLVKGECLADRHTLQE